MSKKLIESGLRLGVMPTPNLLVSCRGKDGKNNALAIGFVTTAIRKERTERSIMNQTGHRSSQTLRGYFVRESAVEDNAGRDLI